MLNRLYPGEIPRYSFYRRLTGPQGQSGHEGMKKNLQPLGPPGPSTDESANCFVVCGVDINIIVRVQRVFQQVFNHDAPTAKRIKKWHDTFLATGTLSKKQVVVAEHPTKWLQMSKPHMSEALGSH